MVYIKILTRIHALSCAMKRLSETWRQKAKTTEQTSKYQHGNMETKDSGILQEGTRRYSQRLAKPTTLKNDIKDVLQEISTAVESNKNTVSYINKENGCSSSSEQSSLFNLSFGFDTQALSAVDKMEQEHNRKPMAIPELSPITPNLSQGSSLPFATSCGKVKNMQSTPNGTTCNSMVGRSKLFVGATNMASSVATNTVVSCEQNVTTAKKSEKLHNSYSKLENKQDTYKDSKPCNGEMAAKSSVKKGLDIESSNAQGLSKYNSTKTDKSKLNEGETCPTNKCNTQNCSESELTQDQCELSSWGLPDNILEQYKKIGIKTMFEWQAQCLRTGNVLNGGNLVYSAPTSAGKTMVAEILMLKRILEAKCKALFILPFVSVAREKMFYLQRMFGESGIKVDGYMGSEVPTKGFDFIDIAVCTIEKANGLVNRLMEAGQLHNVGVIIVDEMHLIGDTSRGYLLELLLTKVLYISQSAADSSSEQNVQIIGMSATLPNLNVLATWLRADLYFTSYRPVPLTETFKIGPVVYDRSGNVFRELNQLRMVSGDDDHVLMLCQETVEEGNGVLVFCPTKSWCEKLAESIAKHFYMLCSSKKDNASLLSLNYDALKDVFEQLRSCQVGIDSVLAKTIRYGVAYHHAGLTYDERDIIEVGFRQSTIKVLVATSTLSSGVNLPARRVIIRTPMFHGKLLDALVYKQMSGRAGRKGVDSQGESIIICKTNERQKARSLMEDDLKPVESCLVVKRSDEDEGNGIKRALLEVIASGVASTPADVQRYARCTFYVSSQAQEDSDDTQNIITNTVRYLEKNEFITLRKNEVAKTKVTLFDAERYVPTQLGQATLASSLSPDEALVVFADLRKARKCFVLENELHILYQVTPIYVQDQWPNLDWYQYLRLWERLPSHMKRVSGLVGVEEGFLNRAIRTRPATRSEAQRNAARVHKRFYVTMALLDLIHEVPLDTVAHRYGASRGMLQSLQSSAATFAGMVTVFCHKLGWNNMEMLLSQFQNRLTFGVERELCDLVRISSLNAFRARVLYSAGYHTVTAVAAASSAEVEKHLRNATPFQSNKKSDGESETELRRRMRAKCVWVKGKKALTESEVAQEIIEQACALLKEDALKLGMTWKPGATISDGVQDLKTVGEKAVSSSEKVCSTNSNSSVKDKNSDHGIVACKGTLKTSKLNQETSAKILTTTSSNTATKSSTENPDVCKNKILLSETFPEKIHNPHIAVSTCNDQSSNGFTATTCGDKSTTPSSRLTNSPFGTIVPLSLPKQMQSNQGEIKSNDAVSETSEISRSTSLPKESLFTKGSRKEAIPEICPQTGNRSKFSDGNTCKNLGSNAGKLRGNKQITSAVRTKPSTDTRRETSKKKRDCSLKRKHSVSKSPKDSNGPKIKLNNHGKPLEKQVNDGESPKNVLKVKNGQNHNQSDNFYSECLDNFKMNEHGTPSKRKERGVLVIESSTDNHKSPSRKASTVNHSRKYCNTTKQNNEALLQGTNKVSNVIKTPRNNNTYSDNSTASKCKSIINEPHPSSLTTPTGKQFEVQDESPELITSSETHDTAPSAPKMPFAEIDYKTTSNMLVTSPEIYSEPLFSDSESAQDQSFEMQIEKMSESSGFENLDVQNLTVSLKKDERKQSVETKSKVPGEEVHTPLKVNAQSNTRPEDVISNLTAICTPGMFDSEMCFSQLAQVPAENSKSLEVVATHPQSKKVQQNSSEQSKTSPEQSRRSSGSFSLRLSQSFECLSDSDLSSRTLAAVAALEEKEMIVNQEKEHSMNNQHKEGYLMDNQGKEGCLMDKQDKEENLVDNQDSVGFQEVSNISLLTLAAIEAIDEELRQSGASNLEQVNNNQKKACESRGNWTNEKQFTEVKQRCLPARPVVTTEPRTSVAIAMSNIQHFLKKTYTGSSLPFDIIDIVKDQNTFEMFVKDCSNSSFSFSVALEKRRPTGSSIGRKFNKDAKPFPAGQKPHLAIEGDNLTVVGVAVCWGKGNVCFLPLEGQESEECKVSWEMRMDSLRKIMATRANKRVKIAFGIKEQYKVLSRACDVVLKGEFQDPKVAAWLLDPGAKEKNFLQMVEHFLPQESNLLQGVVGACRYSGLGLATQSSLPARERSCLDAVFTRMLMDHIRPMLEADGLWEAFTKIEMPAISCLTRMELNGFGFSNNECEQIKHVLRAKLRSLEQEAYGLANRSFSLTSPEEVSRLLFLELKLPPDGQTGGSTSPGKGVRPTRGGRRRKVKYFSTSKDVLEKLVLLHPLPKVILEWRRINSALTKIVFPVQKEQVPCDPPLNMSRIFPTALTHTATGRVTFVEPNLQNVPRDFDINLPTVITDTPPNEDLERTKRNKSKVLYAPRGEFKPSSPGPQYSVSLRSAFVPFLNGILLAADYSQLELRLIAHLSSDAKLTNFLNAGGDALRMIAGEIFHMDENEISDEQRQRAKHVCYGIIYGIGAKALGQTLGVDENEAALFVDAFKARFTAVRAYLKRTVDECRRLGYVTTISGRKRYLPNIRSSNATARSQAERQAVNTTVQGSAADLVKLAMTSIDRRLCEQFTSCWRTHRQKSEGELGKRSRCAKRGDRKFRGGNLVLQLHDELLFEVVEQDFSKVVEIVRDEMENAMQLSVKTPVKMKSGKSWGTMVPME